MKNYFLFLVYIILFVGCHTQKETKLPEICLSLQLPEITLKLSELANDIQIVPLETRDSVLLPNHFFATTEGKNIIISGEDGLYQFSINGKYIRKLLHQGRGPGEYSRIKDCRIDETRELVYLLDGFRHLFICDLKTGKLNQTKTLSFDALKILEIEEDTLLYFGGNTSKDNTAFKFCRMTLDGKIIESIPGSPTKDFASNEYCYQLSNGEIRYKPNKCDTLYRVDHLKLSPSTLLKCSDTDAGYKAVIFPLLENNYLCLLQSTLIHTEKDANGELKSLTVDRGPNCYFDKKTNLTKEFKFIYADSLEMELDKDNFSACQHHLIVPVNALQFKENLREKYTRNQLEPTIRQLYLKVEENDNPILLIGKIKD